MKKQEELRIPFTYENRHPIFLDRCLYIPANYDHHDKWEQLDWDHPSFFGNKNPVVIEYCSGNGQWILDQAKNHPEMNWVAVEKKFDRARKIWKKIHRLGPPNLFVVCGEALDFSTYYVPKNSVHKIFVNFPDPWPKLRHAKHRLIQSKFLESLESILKTRANAFFTTDDFSYLNQMIEEISSRKLWKSLIVEPYFAMDLADYGKSYFYDLWKGKGRTIYHLQFEVESC